MGSVWPLWVHNRRCQGPGGNATLWGWFVGFKSNKHAMPVPLS